MAQKFDDVPYGITDIPDGYMGGLSWEEMELLFRRRYSEAGEPQDKVQAWLDDHQVYPKRAHPATRVMNLDWFGMLGLMREAALWVRDRREEDNPYGSDLV